jgi:hypothetical protein
VQRSDTSVHSQTFKKWGWEQIQSFGKLHSCETKALSLITMSGMAFIGLLFMV